MGSSCLNKDLIDNLLEKVNDTTQPMNWLRYSRFELSRQRRSHTKSMGIRSSQEHSWKRQKTGVLLNKNMKRKENISWYFIFSSILDLKHSEISKKETNMCIIKRKKDVEGKKEKQIKGGPEMEIYVHIVLALYLSHKMCLWLFWKPLDELESPQSPGFMLVRC